MAYRYCEFLRRMHMLDRQPISTRKRKFYKKRINPFTELSEREFRSKYKFSKSSMEKLIAIVAEDLKGDNRGGRIPVELRVMAAIRYWVCNEAQDDAASSHGISQPTLSIISTRVARAFASKANQFIAMPQTVSEQTEIMDKFQDISGFPQVIGVIDCAHIRIQKQGGEDSRHYYLYANRKGYFSINVQAICDPNLKIRDIDCNWRGSTYDHRIYDEGTIKDRFERKEFHGRLIGDGAYACTNHLFTPVQNPTNSSEENYNIAHNATCKTIEQTFRIWKMRFRILITGMRGSLDNVKTLIVALAVLHNLAVDFNDTLDDEDDFQEIDDEDISLTPENEHLLSSDGEIARKTFIETFFPQIMLRA